MASLGSAVAEVGGTMNAGCQELIDLMNDISDMTVDGHWVNDNGSYSWEGYNLGGIDIDIGADAGKPGTMLAISTGISQDTILFGQLTNGITQISNMQKATASKI